MKSGSSLAERSEERRVVGSARKGRVEWVDVARKNEFLGALLALIEQAGVRVALRRTK